MNGELDSSDSTNEIKAYIGDGVYAEIEQDMVLIKTKRGWDMHYIYLDIPTLNNLINFLKENKYKI